ncbi:MAG TPA: lysoplasmalogenase [Anaerolineales bacterium]|nr:lysoplasmalogenase [Anaerolineales bacterium]
MKFTFLFIALAVGALNWVAAQKKRRHLVYFAKPVTMLALLLWMIENKATDGFMLWFMLAVICSLVGDVFLMLPKNYFLPGLASFLVAHVFYIIGLNQTFPPIGPWLLVLGVILALGWVWMNRRLMRSLKAAGHTRLHLVVMFYSAMIGLMALSALLTCFRPEWPLLAALLASAGAILFCLSDAHLAWNRFIRPLRYVHLRVMIPYHLGQMGIIAGAILYYLSLQ